MNSKLIPIAYTVCVIKPNLALKKPVLEEILKTIQDNHFEIYDQKQKTLKSEEILNLFYKYKNSDFYKDIVSHMKSGDSCVLLLINKCETVFDEEKQEDVKLEDPITRFKKLLGKMNPEEAKGEDENCL